MRWNPGRITLLVLLTILAASSMSVTLPKPGYARPDPSPTPLKGINRIAFSESTVMSVRVPRATKISTAGGGVTSSSGLREQEDLFHLDNPDITITGRGRVAGFALVEKGASNQGGRAMLLGANLNFCDRPGCSAEEDPYFYLAGFLESEGDHFVIPKGDYLLYGIADEAPVTITLRLHGLSGRTSLQPRAGAQDVTVSTPADSLTESNSRIGHSYGESYEAAGPEALMLTALRLRGNNWANGRYGLCLYNAEPITPRPIAYSYPCAGGFGVYIGDGFVRTLPYQNLFNTAVHTIGETGQTWSLGGGYLAAAQVDAFDAVQLHLALPDEIAAPVARSKECMRLEVPGIQGRTCFRLPHPENRGHVSRIPRS